jgi:hypothetical protein
LIGMRHPSTTMGTHVEETDLRIHREISSLRSINHGRFNMVCNGDVNVYEYQYGMLAIHRHASLMPMQYIY